MSTNIQAFAFAAHIPRTTEELGAIATHEPTAEDIAVLAYTAASWWADVVVNPTFNNGATDPCGVLASNLASLNTKTISADAITVFRDKLAEIIYNWFDRDFPRHLDSVWINCDYDPNNSWLIAAAESANIPLGNFPWKTCMWINAIKNTIEVRLGYGADIETLPLLTPPSSNPQN